MKLPHILTKSKVLTLRVKQETIGALEEESREKMIPLNALANIIFEEYLEVHRPALKADLIYTPKKLLQELLKEIPKERIPAIAANAAYPGLQSMACMMERGLDFDSMMAAILSMAKHSGYTFSDIAGEDGKRTISLVHHMGIKYSILLQACLEHAFADLKEQDANVQFDISDARLTVYRENLNSNSEIQHG